MPGAVMSTYQSITDRLRSVSICVTNAIRCIEDDNISTAAELLDDATDDLKIAYKEVDKLLMEKEP